MKCRRVFYVLGDHNSSTAALVDNSYYRGVEDEILLIVHLCLSFYLFASSLARCSYHRQTLSRIHSPVVPPELNP